MLVLGFALSSILVLSLAFDALMSLDLVRLLFAEVQTLVVFLTRSLVRLVCVALMSSSEILSIGFGVLLSLGTMKALADAAQPLVFDVPLSRALFALAWLAELCILAFVVRLLAVVMRTCGAVLALTFVLLLSVV